MRCSNLPSQLSTFIGREREVATATRLLHSTRLLTLTGAGGSGKTRLALAVAEPLVRRYPDGVWFVDLAAIEDPALAPQAVADALGLRGAPGRQLIDALVSFLQTRHVLLILDNCEHMVDACAHLAYALLTAAPRLRIVATSREPLHVAGETTWAVPPLARPEPAARPTIEQLVRIESVRLFVERAGRVIPGFALDVGNALPISQICSQLDGSPLAIELAAARIRVLSPSQIASRLGNALGLLVAGDRTAPPRQRSLQAALDWSYDLLSADEQALFGRLAVFAASYSVDAAAAVYGAGEVLDLLAGLVDKSLLDVETGEKQRYRFLEPVRQYARARLELSGEGSHARDLLLAWAVALAEEQGPAASGPSARMAVAQLEVEHPNLRAALEWGLTQPQRAIERHRLAEALCQFWQYRGYISEGVGWFEHLTQDLPAVPVEMQISTLHKAAFLAIHANNFARARQYLERGIALAVQHPQQYELPALYQLLSLLTCTEGDLAEADRFCDLAYPLCERLGDDWGRAIILFLRSNIDFLRQAYSSSRQNIEASAALCRAIGNIPALGRRLVRLGQVLLKLGDRAGAQQTIVEGFRTGREVGDNWGMAMALAALASLALDLGHHAHAAWLLGITQHFRHAFGVPFWSVDELEHERTRAALLAALGEPALEDAVDRGARQAAQHLDAALDAALAERQPEKTNGSAASTTATAGPARDVLGPLSRREREVAALVAQGKSNAEIAAALFVGLRTVEAHVTHILNKLGFNSRSQIAAWMAAQANAPTANRS